MLEAFTNMPKRETSDTGVKKNGELFFEMDMLGSPVPCQLQLFHGGTKYMVQTPSSLQMHSGWPLSDSHTQSTPERAEVWDLVIQWTSIDESSGGYNEGHHKHHLPYMCYSST